MRNESKPQTASEKPLSKNARIRLMAEENKRLTAENKKLVAENKKLKETVKEMSADYSAKPYVEEERDGE